MQVPALAILVICLIASHFVADAVGFDFVALSGVLLTLPFLPFYFVLRAVAPVVKRVFEGRDVHDLLWLRYSYNFAIDCVRSGVASVDRLLEMLGFEE